MPSSCIPLGVQNEPTRPNSPAQPNARPKNKTTLVAFLFLLLFALIMTLRVFRPYLLSVTMGGILALLSHPLFQRLVRYNLQPKRASLVITLGIVLLVMVPLSVFVVITVQQAIAIGEDLAGNGEVSFQSFLDWISRIQIFK